MKRIVFTFFISLLWLHSDAQSTDGAQFNFINNDRLHDLGGVNKNTTITYNVQFKNSGSSPLEISGMHYDTGKVKQPPYTVHIKWPSKPVKPGKKGVITVSFVSGEHIGSFDNVLYVTSNATITNYPLLYLAGAIVPEHYYVEPEKKEPIFPIEMLAPVIRANTK